MPRERQIKFTPKAILKYVIEQELAVSDYSESALVRRALEEHYADKIAEIKEQIRRGELEIHDGELVPTNGAE